jgi:hypothetical protein
MEILISGLINTKPGEEAAANDKLLKDLMRASPNADQEASLAVLRTLLGPKLDRIRQNLKARGLQPADLTPEAQRLADFVLAGIALDEKEVPADAFNENDVPANRKIMAVLVQSLAQTRSAIGKFIAERHDEGPTYLEDVKLLQPFKLDIRKASDLVEFIVVRYFADPQCMGVSTEQRVQVLSACGMEPDAARKALRRTSAATNELAGLVVSALVSDEAQLEKLINLTATPLKLGTALFPQGSPPPAPLPTPDIPCTGTLEVGATDASATP